MSIIQPFLAQNVLPTDLVPAASHWMGLTLKELFILLGAVALVTLPLVIWAAYFRKPAKRGSNYHHHRHSRSETAAAASPEDGELPANGEKSYRRKRRRRREHRPRNPTLAETGGLPPVRSERPPDSLT